MKKRFLARILVTASLAACITASSAMAAYEAPVNFAPVFQDDATGVVYTVPQVEVCVLKSGNTSITPLPEKIYRESSFVCVYHGKIYYIKGDGYEGFNGFLYSCDMRGQNVKLIADNIDPGTTITIVDDMLYYAGFYDGSPQSVGGIYKINLNNLSWKRVVDDRFCRMNYCDGDYIYYTVNSKTYAIDVNGNTCFAARSNTDEFKDGYYIKGNKTYYMDDDNKVLYSKDKNGGNVKVLSRYNATTYIGGISNNNIYTITRKYTTSPPYAEVNAISIQ